MSVTNLRHTNLCCHRKDVRGQRGEGEAYFLVVVLGLAVAVSIGYFVLNFIYAEKERRANIGKTPEAEATPPINIEEMGSYEVQY